MALDVKAIRDGLKTRLATISGLRTYDTVPDKPEVPAAVVMPADNFITYSSAMAKGTVEVRFRVVLLVSRTSETAAQDALDEYLSAGTGQTRSVMDAIRPVNAPQSLGGAAQDCTVEGAVSYGSTDANGVPYLTASLTVLVLADRK